MKTNQFLYERIINLKWVKWVKLPQTLHKKIKKFLMENFIFCAMKANGQRFFAKITDQGNLENSVIY